MTAGIDAQQLFDSLPPPWPQPLLPEIQRRIAASASRFVILDDDPTGGQTLHGLPVLAARDSQTLARELEQSAAFFILTNSRALREAEAAELVRDVGGTLREAAQRSGVDLAPCYRGDSTLRGHFPAETDALYSGLTGSEGAQPTYVFAPYFAEGGRFTVDDTQYVQQGTRLVPAAETEFARDPRFAYTHSHLPSWLEKRTAGRVRAADVVSVSIADLRLDGPEAVCRKLSAVPEGGMALMNAACDRDVEVFVMGLLDAEAAGHRFVYRTAASFVRVRAGIATRPLLSARERQSGGGPGLVVVGSYVGQTTRQLEALLAQDRLHGVELRVPDLLAGDRGAEVRAATEVSRAMSEGRDAALYTSREFVAADNGLDAVALSERISGALCRIVGGLERRPGFLVVKGGSTAHAIAVQGLGMQRAVVLGQLLAGVPVWRLGPESKYPDLPLVVFPGNVGGADALAGAVRSLRGNDAGPGH